MKYLNIFELSLKDYKELNFFTIFSNFKVGSILKIIYKRSNKQKLNYSLTGICIAKKNKQQNTLLILRNVLTLFHFEFKIPVYSPEIHFLCRKEQEKRKYTSAKLYYLRNKTSNQSKVQFTYLASGKLY